MFARAANSKKTRADTKAGESREGENRGASREGESRCEKRRVSSGKDIGGSTARPDAK